MPSDKFYCDDHVPRGCYCNSKHITEDGLPDKSNKFIWLDDKHTLCEYLDDKGRREPCCEFEFSEKRF